jgi:GNAT superfamily N-acetyltransferase
MSCELDFCKADASAVYALTDLINRAFRIERFFVDGDRITAPDVGERLRTGEFILAKSGDQIVGSVYVELRRPRCYVGLLAVEPSRQKQGVGTRLMAAAEEYGRAHGAEAMDLQIVNLREEMARFYARHGYMDTGTAPFPPGVPTKLKCHFITMAKTL